MVTMTAHCALDLNLVFTIVTPVLLPLSYPVCPDHTNDQARMSVHVYQDSEITELHVYDVSQH